MVQVFKKAGVLRGVPNEVSLVERLSLCGARGGEACFPNDTLQPLTRARVVLTRVFSLTMFRNISVWTEKQLGAGESTFLSITVTVIDFLTFCASVQLLCNL